MMRAYEDLHALGYAHSIEAWHDGELVGGRNLLTGSAGYQYRVLDNWWAATFIDAGAAFDTLESYLEHVSLVMDLDRGRRYGTIEEQVAPILFFASDESSYITGSVLPVGGGDLG